MPEAKLIRSPVLRSTYLHIPVSFANRRKEVPCLRASKMQFPRATDCQKYQFQYFTNDALTSSGCSIPSATESLLLTVHNYVLQCSELHSPHPISSLSFACLGPPLPSLRGVFSTPCLASPLPVGCISLLDSSRPAPHLPAPRPWGTARWAHPLCPWAPARHPPQCLPSQKRDNRPLSAFSPYSRLAKAMCPSHPWPPAPGGHCHTAGHLPSGVRGLLDMQRGLL